MDRKDYHPCQPGYRQAGKLYMELDYSGDCKLGKYVSELFEVQRPTVRGIQVIPDGCNDIVFTGSGGKVTGWLSPSVHSAVTFYFEKAEWILGVRFLPGTTGAIFHDNPAYSKQCATDIDMLFPDFGPVKQEMGRARSFMKRYELITDFLLERAKGFEPVEDLVSACVHRLIDTRGLASIEELSDLTGYSGRYIRRLFALHVGHSPKELGNIIRMQCAIRDLWEDPAASSLGELASRFGFSDQSHMNREFRKFLGLTSGRVKDCENWVAYLKASATRNFPGGPG